MIYVKNTYKVKLLKREQQYIIMVYFKYLPPKYIHASGEKALNERINSLINNPDVSDFAIYTKMKFTYESEN